MLDVGCGTGVITAALAERGCTVVGLDASEPYLEGVGGGLASGTRSWVRWPPVMTRRCR